MQNDFKERKRFSYSCAFPGVWAESLCFHFAQGQANDRPEWKPLGISQPGQVDNIGSLEILC